MKIISPPFLKLVRIMSRITTADIFKVVPITRKRLWLWQKNTVFFGSTKRGTLWWQRNRGLFSFVGKGKMQIDLCLAKKELHHFNDPKDFGEREKISPLE
jgi:hypothetical protein